MGVSTTRTVNPAMSLGGSRQSQITASMAGWDDADFGTDSNQFMPMAAPTASKTTMSIGHAAPQMNLRTQANVGFAGGMMAAAPPRRATITMAAKSDEPTVTGELEIKATADYQDMLFYSKKYDRLSDLPHYVGNQYKVELMQNAKALSRPGYGILASDESNGTCGKRFEAIGVENIEENRRRYR